MAKSPPSAKRDCIDNFTPALVDYTNEVLYGEERKGFRNATPASSGSLRSSRPPDLT